MVELPERSPYAFWGCLFSTSLSVMMVASLPKNPEHRTWLHLLLYLMICFFNFCCNLLLWSLILSKFWLSLLRNYFWGTSLFYVVTVFLIRLWKKLTGTINKPQNPSDKWRFGRRCLLSLLLIFQHPHLLWISEYFTFLTFLGYVRDIILSYGRLGTSLFGAATRLYVKTRGEGQ
jgi:hypothetical protein